MKRISFSEIKDQRFDVIIVGGGLTGACVARDAAQRGLKTVLLEMCDFCSGDTARGSRLLAGEWAFPMRLDEKPTRSALQELELLPRQAPHLVRPVTSLFLSPAAPGSPSFLLQEEERSLLSWLRTHPSSIKSKVIPVRKLQGTFDYLASESLWGGFQSTDHLVPSTERLCLENLLSAVQDGAVVINYARVTGVHVHNRQVFGIQAEDQLSGRNFSLQTDCVINAAGSSAEQICLFANAGSTEKVQVFEELYLALPQLDNRLGLALFLALKEQEIIRCLSLTPWYEQLIFGPSRPYKEKELDSAKTRAGAIAELLGELAQMIDPDLAAKISPIFTFSTHFSIPAGSTGNIASRPLRFEVMDHNRTSGPRGLISVFCPRAALSRLAAKEAVDLSHAYTPSAKARHECGTHSQTLFGGNITNIEEYLQEVSHAARQFQLQDRQVRHLVGLYGTKAQELFALFRSHPTLREQICPHQPDLKAQLVYAVEQEAAVTLGDIFLRRTAMGLTRCRGKDCAHHAADFLGDLLGWTKARVEAEVENLHREYNAAYRHAVPPEAASR